MNYREFKEYIKNKVTEKVGEKSRVELRKIMKNNDCEMDAIIIATGDECISPTIYLRDYYELYKEGFSISEIADMICDKYERYRLEADINAQFFMSFDNIREKIAYKLVSRERNKKLLRDVPHMEFLDLAIVFYILIDKEPIENAVALIHNSHLSLWNITPSQLYMQAMENTPKLLEYRIISMADMLEDIFCESGGECDEELADICNDIRNTEHVGMYVITNHIKTNGAACILYNDVIRNFAKKIGSDIYIIPSSIHEVIIVPDVNVAKEELNSMIKQVNSEELMESEILSEHVYKYIMDEDKIVIP